MEVSQAVIEKGERIVTEGRIERVRKGRYMVTSETGRRYFVHKGRCRCLWRYYEDKRQGERVCSHAYASLLAERVR